MDAVLAGLTLYCITIGLVQLAFLLGMGIAESRRQARADPMEPWVAGAVFALIPCLDEEAVIGPTVAALADAHPSVRILVIDDASQDETAAVAEAAAPGRVEVLRRVLPEARQGKGPALNHAYAEVLRAVDREGLDPDQVVVLVMDADGRLSPGAVALACAPFADPRVGGVQLGVRIRNRRANLLATIQDCEFWGIAALGQLGRVRTSTVSLGGNGQFTRLSALRSVGAAPWSDALTEDLDLAVTLAVGGWHLSSVSGCWVSQQGLTRLRPLVRQRTRWFQGHMTTALGRLPDVWRSPHLSNAATLEMTSYLLIPFVIVLPWSVLSQYGLVTTLRHVGLGGFAPASGLPGPRWVFPLLAWYLLSFAPTIACGITYARRERDISLLRAVAFCHLLVLWNYVLFVSCWAALARMVRGDTGWAKTARVDEGVAVEVGS